MESSEGGRVGGGGCTASICNASPQLRQQSRVVRRSRVVPFHLLLRLSPTTNTRLSLTAPNALIMAYDDSNSSRGRGRGRGRGGGGGGGGRGASKAAMGGRGPSKASQGEPGSIPAGALSFSTILETSAS